MARHFVVVTAAFVLIGSACGVLESIGIDEGERPDGVDDDADDDGDALSPFARTFLEAHNEARRSASPSPSPSLPPLTWSSDLADVAQAWAERCVFEHSANAFGENLALFSPRAINDDTSREVVGIWNDEHVDYDLVRNSCAAGEQCGHYTQLVWRDTQRVGCGVAECGNVAGFGAGSMWVCNYDPPGNYVGETPY